MADNEPDVRTDDDTTTEPKPEPRPEPQGDGTDWKAEARKWEKRAKENSDAAKRLKDAEDADKSELEKFTERATTAEKRAEDAERRAWRLEVAADKGLTPTQAKRLQGSTREELEADADELRKDLGLDKAEGDDDSERRRPKEKLRPGASNEDDQVEDPNKLADSVLRRKQGY